MIKIIFFFKKFIKKIIFHLKMGQKKTNKFDIIDIFIMKFTHISLED